MTQITEDTFEQILQFLDTSSPIDIHEVTFVDPYGMVGLLEIGELLTSKGIQKTIHLPKSKEKEVNLTYFPGAQINILLPEI